MRSAIDNMKLKRPLNYYGGKYNMLPKIMPMIPNHKTYVEGCAGGAALFFYKNASPVEILNDTNGNLIKFYKQLKHNFDELNSLIQDTLHHEYEYKKARTIYQNPEKYTDLEIAWCVWVGANMSFGGSMFNGAFQITTNSNDVSHPGSKSNYKRIEFNKGLFQKRLEKAMILEQDVLKILKKFNNNDIFHYIDPPYFQANQGHYKGYTEKDFINLLDTSSDNKSKIMISCYPSYEIFNEYPKFKVHEFEMTLGVKLGDRKTEVILTNYDVPKNKITQGKLLLA